MESKTEKASALPPIQIKLIGSSKYPSETVQKSPEHSSRYDSRKRNDPIKAIFRQSGKPVSVDLEKPKFIQIRRFQLTQIANLFVVAIRV